MAELVDATDLKSVVRKDVRVQVPPRVPYEIKRRGHDVTGMGGQKHFMEKL